MLLKAIKNILQEKPDNNHSYYCFALDNWKIILYLCYKKNQSKVYFHPKHVLWLVNKYPVNVTAKKTKYRTLSKVQNIYILSSIKMAFFVWILCCLWWEVLKSTCRYGLLLRSLPHFRRCMYRSASCTETLKPPLAPARPLLAAVCTYLP